MAAVNRAALITRLYKVLKKHYTPSADGPARPVLEQMLFACCLEDAPAAKAEDAFRALSATFFDWNEVRVSMTKELAEVMSMLPDSSAAAQRLRQTLQSVFEATYSFDVESIKKLGLGQATKRLEKFEGITPFVISYTVQHALGGHAIPVDQGAFGALTVLGIVSEAERAKGITPGLERAIPKNKGIEFAKLLHQLGVEFVLNPYSTNLHKLLLEVSPECKPRLPRRLTKREKEQLEQARKEAAARKAAEAAAEQARRLAKEAKAAEAARKKLAPPADKSGTKPGSTAKPQPQGKGAPPAHPAASKSVPPTKPAPPTKPTAAGRPAEVVKAAPRKDVPPARGQEGGKPKLPDKSKSPPVRGKLPLPKGKPGDKGKSSSTSLTKRKPK